MDQQPMKQKFDQENPVPLHPDQINEGEGGCDVSKLDVPSKFTVVKKIIARTIKELFLGNFNVFTMQKPALVTYPMSQIGLCARDFQIITHYVKTANETKNHLDRLQWITAGFFASYLYTFSSTNGRAPMSCFIGETYQGKLSDGSLIFAECLQITPFEMAFEIIGPNNSFKIEGEQKFEMKIQKACTRILSINTGKIRVTLQDGSQYETVFPNFKIQNPLGKMSVMVTDKAIINDINQNMFAELEFVDPKDKDFKPNLVKVLIKKKINDSEVVIGEGQGYQNQYIQFNDEIFWRWDQKFEDFSTADNVLPSDISNRPPNKLIEEKNFDQADKVLDQEIAQFRNDQAMRAKQTKLRLKNKKQLIQFIQSNGVVQVEENCSISFYKNNFLEFSSLDLSTLEFLL